MTDYDPTRWRGSRSPGVERLEQNRQGLYTSDLSVNEFLLVTQAGFDPVGLVVGSSIFHIGFQVAGPTTSRELDVLSEAMYSARHLAMTRMEEEADQLGADGIVGVRLDIGRYEWGPNMAEFIAIGTAVKHREGVLHRAPNGRPFQSDLSGQEFWTLLRTGHRPVGMVMGSCVYHVGRRGPLRTIAQTGRNVELPELHPGALRRARAGDAADADRGPGARAPRASSACRCRSEPRLGQPRDRVLRARDRDHPVRGAGGRSSPRSRCSTSTTAESLGCSSGYALECWSVSPSGESSSCDGAPGSLSAESLCDPPSAPGSSGRSSGAVRLSARSRCGLTAGSWG